MRSGCSWHTCESPRKRSLDTPGRLERPRVFLRMFWGVSRAFWRVLSSLWTGRRAPRLTRDRLHRHIFGSEVCHSGETSLTTLTHGGIVFVQDCNDVYTLARQHPKLSKKTQSRRRIIIVGLNKNPLWTRAKIEPRVHEAMGKFKVGCKREEMRVAAAPKQCNAKKCK